MTEQECMERIRKSAESIEVPERILPENIQKGLKHRRTVRAEKQAIAAVMLLVCSVGAIAGYRIFTPPAGQEETAQTTASEQEEEAVQENVSVAEDVRTAGEAVERKDAGALYTVAEDYGEVYDALAKNDTSYVEDFSYRTGEVAIKSNADAIVQNSTAGAGAMQEETAAVSHSETNIQTYGVDESDIIKTDGSYIYVIKKNEIKIVDIRRDRMREAATVGLPSDSASDRIMELYIDGDLMQVILQGEHTTLSRSTDGAYQNAMYQDAAEAEDAAADRIEDVYAMDTSIQTELLTYDIRDRENVKLVGSVEQDGAYLTSRKIGSITYLFTNQRLSAPGMTREEVTITDQAGGWIPIVNGSAIAADCIYLPAEQGSQGLIISSVSAGQPDVAADSMMIVNNNVEPYVSADALYLYGSRYMDGGIYTDIAKFALDDGIIYGIGAASVEGEVYDTFAVNEHEGKLRILTTDRSGSEEENNLYLYDEQMNLTGSLTGIAKGEDIYAARYLGDMVYFVTYRNTDPLFAVDLSDETAPKVVSELSITGFSEYLHFWGMNRLVGIGYETDPETGIQKGIKLTMFDLSEPEELKVLGSCVIENVDGSSAFYNYKEVLADAGENLLGFGVTSYRSGSHDSYLLFSWEDGRFRELLTEELPEELVTGDSRGLYAGDRFYLVNENGITSYDRTQEYQKLEEIAL